MQNSLACTAIILKGLPGPAMTTYSPTNDRVMVASSKYDTNKTAFYINVLMFDYFSAILTADMLTAFPC